MNQQTSRLPRFFFRTSPQPCPYLAGRMERNIFTEIGGPEAASVYGALVRHGFRRSHRIVYRPDCPTCSACTPARVVVGEFRPSRSLKRVWKTNADLRVEERPARGTSEQYNLFRRYVARRHGDGEMAAMTFDDYCGMIEETPVETRVVEFREAEGALVASCLVDALGDGLSAVYSFFDPAHERRSLGTHMVLWVIEAALARGLDHAYLGYWIEASAKMAYKARFEPLELLGSEGWQRRVVVPLS